jgi:hypothetical protein
MKNNIKLFIGILIGLVFGVSAAVGATALYNSSEVGFTPTDSNWNVNNVEDAINDLYSDKIRPKLIYSNPSNISIRETNIAIDSNVDTILVECYDNNKSYYVKLEKGMDCVCGYHYFANNVWYENNRYLEYTDNNLHIGYPRTINLSSGSIVHPSDSVLFIKNIYEINN